MLPGFTNLILHTLRRSLLHSLLIIFIEVKRIVGWQSHARTGIILCIMLYLLLTILLFALLQFSFFFRHSASFFFILFFLFHIFPPFSLFFTLSPSLPFLSPFLSLFPLFMVPSLSFHSPYILFFLLISFILLIDLFH
jgi:hypothetical protein